MALTSAQRKEKSRQLQRDKGLVLFSISDVWGTQTQKAIFDKEVAILIAKTIKNSPLV